MSEDYCSFETAKLLKEKGSPFIEHLYMYVDANNRFMTDHSACLALSTEEYCKHFDELFTPTITHQMAMKWLRCKGIYIEIDVLGKTNIKYGFTILKLNEGEIYSDDKIYTTFEEAVEAALKYCLTKFPELKESKDERIRKGLIKTISSLLDNTILYHTDITKEEALVWLEKQKGD